MSLLVKRIEKARNIWAAEGLAQAIAAACRSFYGLAADPCSRMLARFLDGWCEMSSLLTARLTHRPLVHVIGDSHVLAFKRQPSFLVYHVGPATAYKLGQDHSTTQGRQRVLRILNRVKSGDIALLSFGEIDCRIHIYYQYKKHDERIPLSQWIDRTIVSYGAFLLDVAKRGCRLCVYGIPPAGRQPNRYGYPYYAAPDLRVGIFREFNERLKAFCAAQSIPYIDIFVAASDGEGFISEEFASDEVHLNARAVEFVRGWFNRELGIDLS
ncbi:MAG: SGNH/GDSL hydrolase family protein [Nitrospirota bacterium]